MCETYRELNIRVSVFSNTNVQSQIFLDRSHFYGSIRCTVSFIGDWTNTFRCMFLTLFSFIAFRCKETR